MMDRRCSLSDSELNVIDGGFSTLYHRSHFFSPSSSPNFLSTEGRIDIPEASLEEEEVKRREEQQQSFTFDNRAGLAHDMSFIASMPELCDITFFVGEDRQPVCGVRAVIAARSR